MEQKYILIREATVNDAKQIAEMHELSFRESHKARVSKSFLDKLTLDEFIDAWRKRLIDKNVRTLIATEQKKIIGVLCVVLPTNKNQDLPEITRFYIHPDFQAKGIGSRLFNEMQRTLKKEGFKHLFIWTPINDPRAQAFMQKVGAFTKSNERQYINRGEVFPQIRYEAHF